MMPQVLPKMWATHHVGVIGNNCDSYLIWKSETPNSVPEDLTMGCRFAYHVTRTPRQKIHLIPISEVDKGHMSWANQRHVNSISNSGVYIPLCSSDCRGHKGNGSQKELPRTGIDPTQLAFEASGLTRFWGKCDRTHITRFQGNWDVRCTIGASLHWHRFSNR